MVVVEAVTEPCTVHGEGPVWHPGWGGLRWVDMLAGDVLSLDADGAVTRRTVGTVAALVRPRAAGGFVVAVERGLVLVDADGREEAVPDICPPGTRMNEGGCDPSGRLFVGSVAWDEAPGRADLYRVDADRTVTTVLSGITISNGIGWSPDGSRAYYVDSPTGRIDVFDAAEDGRLVRRGVLAEIPAEDGLPDGLTVDADGGVWVALWQGGAVRRYSQSGRLDEQIDLPVRQVTACAFGGDRLDELYITTSRKGLDEPEPEAGALFRAAVGIRGMPTAGFRG